MDFATRPAQEAKTHELLAGYLVNVSLDNMMAYALAPAFRAGWASSRTANDWATLAEVLSGAKLDRPAVEDELTRMVRAKVLRSRKSGGQRVYEMNY